MVVLAGCIGNRNYVMLPCNDHIKITTKVGPRSWRLCLIIGCGFDMYFLAFMGEIMTLIFSIGAISYRIYLMAIQMEMFWVNENGYNKF